MTFERWQNPESWRRPARVAFANLSAVNHEDLAQQVIMEGDAEIVPARPYTEAGQVDPAIAEADVVVATGGPHRYDEAFFAALKQTRLFIRPYVGFDDVDVDAATRHGVLVCNMADAIYDDVSNQTMALMLGLDRQVLRNDRWVRSGGWPQTGRRLLEGLTLHRPATKTLGLIGFGVIGQAVAKKAAPFGYTIIAADPFGNPTIAQGLGVELVAQDDLLRRADVVSLHCFLNDETRGMINAEKLALMKPTAVIINTARGPIVNEPDLIDALQRGRIAGAGLDVMAVEPLPAASPLIALDNVILSGHIAGTSVEGVNRMRTRAGEVALQVAGGGLPQRHMVVNKGLYDQLVAAPELATIPRS